MPRSPREDHKEKFEAMRRLARIEAQFDDRRKITREREKLSSARAMLRLQRLKNHALGRGGKL